MASYSNRQAHQKLIGKRLIHDICNKDGEVLIASFTIFNDEHKQLLEEQQILLSDIDVIDIGPYGSLTKSEHESMIDEVIEHIKDIFQVVRQTRKIPLLDIRRRIIPYIFQAVEQSALFDMFAALQTKDNDYIYRHSIAVGVISALIGKWLNFKESDLFQLTTSALLHDVGITQLSDEILNKPGELTEKEFEYTKRHTILGYEMIKETVGMNHRQALAVLQHHERMDGQGYPLGLEADQIGMFSRIITIADVFNSMSSKRVYRNASPFYEVLLQMEQYAHIKFDATIVRLFVDKIMQHTVGYKAILSDGTVGKIIHINPQNPSLPLIQVQDKLFDLSKDNTLKIEQIIF